MKHSPNTGEKKKKNIYEKLGIKQIFGMRIIRTKYQPQKETKPSQQACLNCKNPAPNKWIAIDVKGNCAECGAELEGKKLFPPQQECCECYCEKCKDCYRQPCKVHKSSEPYIGTPTTTDTGTYFPPQKKDTRTYEETLETVRKLSKLMQKEGWEDSIQNAINKICEGGWTYEGAENIVMELLATERQEVEEMMLEVIGDPMDNYVEWRKYVNKQYEDGRKDKKSRVILAFQEWLYEEQRAKLQRILKKGV